MGSVGKAVALSPQSAPGPLCHLPHGALQEAGLGWGGGRGVGLADSQSPASSLLPSLLLRFALPSKPAPPRPERGSEAFVSRTKMLAADSTGFTLPPGMGDTALSALGGTSEPGLAWEEETPGSQRPSPLSEEVVECFRRGWPPMSFLVQL